MKKKLIIGCVCVFIAIIAVIAVVVGINSKKSFPKTIAKDFTKAVKSDEGMEKFAKKYVDFKTAYVLTSINVKNDEIQDKEKMEKRINEAKKGVDSDDVEEYRDKMIQDLKDFVDEDVKLKVKKVNKIEEFKASPVCDQVTVVYTDENGDDVEYVFIYYKDKLVMFGPADLLIDESDVVTKTKVEKKESVNLIVEEDEESSDEDDSSNKNRNTTNTVSPADPMSVLKDKKNEVGTVKGELTQQEILLYNARFENYLGDSVRGSEVRALIDDIIACDLGNVDVDGKFIELSVYSIVGYDGSTVLANACKTAKNINNVANVKDAVAEMGKVKQKISANKNYKVTAEYEKGVIVEIKLSDV